MMRKTLLMALPQGITLGGAFFGLLAMVWAPHHAYWACLAIIGASLCDMVDGRVARMTGTQSAFGAQLDSLADVLSFGAAPAYLVYVWGIAPSWAGDGFDASLLLVFVFTACSALRLARFNLGGGASSPYHMQGLPTPVAALLPTTMIMAWHEVDLPFIRQPALLVAVLLVLGGLMVSRIPFPSYKRFRSRRRQIAYFAAIMGGLTLLVLQRPGGTVLLALLLVYFAQGGIEMATRRGEPAAEG